MKLVVALTRVLGTLSELNMLDFFLVIFCFSAFFASAATILEYVFVKISMKMSFSA